MSGDHAGAGIAQLGTDPLPLAWLTVANSPKRQQKTLQWRVVLGTLSATRFLVVLAIDSLTRVMLFEVYVALWHPETHFKCASAHCSMVGQNLEGTPPSAARWERGWLLVAEVGRRSIKIHFLVNFESWCLVWKNGWWIRLPTWRVKQDIPDLACIAVVHEGKPHCP